MGDAYAITTTETINANQKFTIKFNVASTTAPTLKINTETVAPVKKANGNNAKLYASAYTLFWDGVNFILLGEGGEYGTATASDVKKTETFGTENGVIQGTMPFLPSEYVGNRILFKTIVSPTMYTNVFSNAAFTLDGNTIFFNSNISPYHTFKYDILNKQLTDMGLVGASGPAHGICCSDDGNVVYVYSADSFVYYWNGSSWVSTNQILSGGYDNITTNLDGSELYFITGSSGGAGTAVKRWVKATSTMSIISAQDGIITTYINSFKWVDDGSLWINFGSSIKKIKISDGTVLKTIGFTNAPSAWVLHRDSSLPVLGSYIRYFNTWDFYRVNNDGSSTQVSAVSNTAQLVGSKTGSYQAISSNDTSNTFKIYHIASGTDELISLNNVFSGFTVALSEDYCRWFTINGLYSNYLYQ